MKRPTGIKQYGIMTDWRRNSGRNAPVFPEDVPCASCAAILFFIMLSVALAKNMTPAADPTPSPRYVRPTVPEEKWY